MLKRDREREKQEASLLGTPVPTGRRSFLRIACAALAGAAAEGLGLAAPHQEPFNILFILLDDFGWRDSSPYGNSFIDTPNIARLASESVRFTNAYAACPVCSPTRASLLTGKYPARLHLTDYIPGRRPWPYWKLKPPAFNLQLPLEERTVARALKPRGYRSAAVGKWHLGGPGFMPTDHGFAMNIAGSRIGHPPHYFGPLEFPNLRVGPGESLTRRLTDEGMRFITQSASRPFFLYQAHYTVHTPLEAEQQVIEKYKQRDIGDVDPIYCAMVESADESVGQLLRALDEAGQSNRTIVIFFSDNGGLRYQEKRPRPITNNTPLRAGKGHLYEGGIREPLLIRWPGVTRPATVIDDSVSSIDFFPTLCNAAGVRAGQVDGVDLQPLLRGGALRQRPLFWHYPHYSDQGGVPSGAVRLGEWKLIEFYEDGRRELFHVSEDPGEQRNLVEREPARARALYELLADWRQSVDAAMPAPNPGYDPERAREGLVGYEAPTPPVVFSGR